MAMVTVMALKLLKVSAVLETVCIWARISCIWSMDSEQKAAGVIGSPGPQAVAISSSAGAIIQYLRHRCIIARVVVMWLIIDIQRRPPV